MYKEAYNTYFQVYLEYENKNKIANSRLPIIKLKQELKKLNRDGRI